MAAQPVKLSKSPSLLDILNQRAPGATLPASAGAAPGATEAAQGLLAAGSGKVAPVGGAPRISNLAEQQAASAGGAELRAAEVAEAPAAQAIALDAGQAAAAQTAQRAAEAQRLEHLRAEGARRMVALADDFQDARHKLRNQEADALADQLGRDLRLRSDQYVTDLGQRGEIARLGDAASWRIAAQESQFANDRELLDQKIGYADWLGMDEDAKKRALAELDLDWALKTAAQEAATANTAAQYAAAGGAASAGAAGYSEYKSGSFDQGYQNQKAGSYAEYQTKQGKT